MHHKVSHNTALCLGFSALSDISYLITSCAAFSHSLDNIAMSEELKAFPPWLARGATRYNQEELRAMRWALSPGSQDTRNTLILLYVWRAARSRLPVPLMFPRVSWRLISGVCENPLTAWIMCVREQRSNDFEDCISPLNDLLHITCPVQLSVTLHSLFSLLNQSISFTSLLLI